MGMVVTGRHAWSHAYGHDNNPCNRFPNDMAYAIQLPLHHPHATWQCHSKLLHKFKISTPAQKSKTKIIKLPWWMEIIH